MPSKSTASLSHQEIWDDSALIQSWDEALEEYKLYHSIHASGKRVRNVLPTMTGKNHETSATKGENDIDNGLADEIPPAGVGDEEAPEEGEVTEELGDARAEQKLTQAHTEGATNSAEPREFPASHPPTNNTAHVLPQQLTGGVADEGLKNLMMAWYYAGYYTGLYEGRQQQQQQQL